MFGKANRQSIGIKLKKKEFVKRAGFAHMASLAVHDENAPDEAFQTFLDAILRESWDERNFVRESVTWALRQIGKRKSKLYRMALDKAMESDSGLLFEIPERMFENTELKVRKG